MQKVCIEGSAGTWLLPQPSTPRATESLPKGKQLHTGTSNVPPLHKMHPNAQQLNPAQTPVVAPGADLPH